MGHLDYYERIETDHALPFFPNPRAGCFILNNDIGGEFDATGPEVCAQLCLSDPCCQAFEVDSATKRCFISHETAFSKPDDFHCDEEFTTTYYEREFSTSASFTQPSPSLANAFESPTALKLFILDQLSDEVREVTLQGDAFGSRVRLRLVARSGDILDSLVSRIQTELLPLRFPGNRSVVLEFEDTEGPCAPGTVSVNGQKPCVVCRAGTYSARSSTECVTCPSGSTSNASATTINECFEINVSEEGG